MISEENSKISAMNILMTFYAYPLSEKVLISKTLNAYLDNPRTEEEITAVREYIVRSYSKGSAFNFPPYSDEDIVTLDGFIQQFCAVYGEKDSFVSNFCQTYDRENIYDFMARMWIVARYDDEGEKQNLKVEANELREEGHSNFFFLLDDENPLVKNPERLSEYSYLMSLFIHTEISDYYGSSFILDTNSNQFDEDSEISRFLPLSFLYFGMGSRETENVHDELRWHFFPSVQSEITLVAQRFDDAFESGLADKLLYVASLLKTVGHDIDDIKTKLVILVSIIELLLTHNPDFNRFNIEDSISKQFRLKASLLIYLSDKSQNINEIKNRLKSIYDLRSAIAHGDFKKVEKYNKAHSYKDEDDRSIDSLITALYNYIRIILNAYLSDSQFVDFLKEN